MHIDMHIMHIMDMMDMPIEVMAVAFATAGR